MGQHVCALIAMSDTNIYGRSAQPREVPSQTGELQTVFMDDHPRCNGSHKGRPCRKLLAEFVTRPWRIKCIRCGTTNVQNIPAPLRPE